MKDNACINVVSEVCESSFLFEQLTASLKLLPITLICLLLFSKLDLQVIYEIEYSGTSGIQSASVQFKISNISVNSRSSLQQRFTMHFWVSIPFLLGVLPCL